MQKTLMSKSFEQIRTTALPKEIMKIIIGLARELRKSARKRALQPKQLEAAYATLHMRIYQRYGYMSKDLMNQAFAELERLLSGDQSSPTGFGGFRKTVLGRFF